MKTSSTGDKRRVALPGFSLMEMLIVVTLFALSMMVMAQTFVSFNQLHRKIANRAIVSQDLRFTTELLVRAARNRPISYVAAPPPKDSQLKLMQANGVEMIIKRSLLGDAACEDLPTVACLLLSTDGGTTWTPITGKRINVEQFDVYAFPSQSPFVLAGGVYPNNLQPFVTFTIGMRYMADNVKEREALKTQTTVSTRIYLR